MILFTLVLILVIVLSIVYLKPRQKSYNLLKRFNCPPTFPLIGNLYKVFGNKEILQTVETWMTMCGQSILIYLSNKPYFIVNDPKMVEFILHSDNVVRSPEYKYFAEWFRLGLVTHKEDTWVKLRHALGPCFENNYIKEYFKVFDKYSTILVDKLELEEGEDSFNIFEPISLCSMDIICEIVMGTEVNAQEDPDSQFVTNAKKLKHILYNRLFSPYRFQWIYYFSQKYHEEKRVIKMLREFSQKIIKTRKQELLKEKPKAGRKKYTLLDCLLKSEIDRKPIPDEQIREEMDILVFSGSSTVTTALCFTLYSLSKHASVQKEVYDELMTICGGKNKTRPTTLKKLNAMKYLDLVIKESLRLYPPVSAYARLVVEDLQFDDIVIPKGVSTVLLPYLMHRDPIIYPDPKKFDPNRFTDENASKRHPFSYFPFSAGSRNCIGQKLAILELKCILSKILLHYEVLPAIPDSKVNLIIRLTLESSNGINVRIRKRE